MAYTLPSQLDVYCSLFVQKVQKDHGEKLKLEEIREKSLARRQRL